MLPGDLRQPHAIEHLIVIGQVVPPKLPLKKNAPSHPAARYGIRPNGSPDAWKRRATRPRSSRRRPVDPTIEAWPHRCAFGRIRSAGNDRQRQDSRHDGKGSLHARHQRRETERLTRTHPRVVTRDSAAIPSRVPGAGHLATEPGYAATCSQWARRQRFPTRQLFLARRCFSHTSVSRKSAPRRPHLRLESSWTIRLTQDIRDGNLPPNANRALLSRRGPPHRADPPYGSRLGSRRRRLRNDIGREILGADIFCGHAKVPVPWDEVVSLRRLQWIQSSAAGTDHCLVDSRSSSPTSPSPAPRACWPIRSPNTPSR